MITTSLGLKAGYLFRKQRFIAYLKLGISRISGKDIYDLNWKNFSNASINAISPNITIGGEYRINKKIGSSMEIGFHIKKRIHKRTIKGIEHKSKISRVEVGFWEHIQFRKQIPCLIHYRIWLNEEKRISVRYFRTINCRENFCCEWTFETKKNKFTKNYYLHN